MQILKSFIKRILEKGTILGNVYVDVGAHRGGIAELLIKHNPDTECHLIEPFSRNCKILKNKGFNVNRYAIAGYNGEVSLYYRNDRKGTKSCSIKKSQLEAYSLKKEKVPCITLDSFCKNIKQIDVLKMNCEGAEYEIFEAPCEWLKKTTVIFLQLHAGQGIIMNKLENAGFVLKKEKGSLRSNQWWSK